MEPGFCRGRHIKRKGGQTKTLHHPNFNWGQTKTLHHPNFNWLQNYRWTGMETCMSSVLAYFVHLKSFVWPWWGRFVSLGHFLVFVVCVCVYECVCEWVSAADVIFTACVIWQECWGGGGKVLQPRGLLQCGPVGDGLPHPPQADLPGHPVLPHGQPQTHVQVSELLPWWWLQDI